MNPRILSVAAAIDKELADELNASVVRLGNLLASRDIPDSKKKTALRQVRTYLQKKCVELDPVLTGARESSLRRIRNDLAHGKIHRDLDLAPLYPELWRAIARLGARLGPSEIENLLAYTLDVPNMRACSRGASAARIVQIYKPMFNALNSEEQRALFSELLLRLFTDGDALEILEGRREK